MDHIVRPILPARSGRIAWLDCAKGVCIVFVVMLYATELVARTAGSSGWLHPVEAFVKPFRMPDFFLLSGLLLARVIERDWRTYIDRKVVHFAYFYVLWLSILFLYEAPRMAAAHGWPSVGTDYLKAYVNPFSMLWFIYMLPVFFIVTKALRRAPVALVWACAAALQIAQPDTGVKAAEKFALYFVYFYTGFVVAPLIIRAADRARATPGAAWCAVAAWALVNGWAVHSGHASLPLASLALAFAGAMAVVAASALTCHLAGARALAYCGRHSLVVYLGFLIPMEVTRKVMADPIADTGLLALASTAGGVIGALVLHHLVRGTRFSFLFERPARIALPGTGWRATARYAGVTSSSPMQERQ